MYQNAYRQITIPILLILFSALLFALTFVPAAYATNRIPPKETISILFSHDMHSHLDAERITRDGITEEKGGFAKMHTAIQKVKQEYPDSFLLDAGDFSMGTPYQTIYTTEAAELRMMGALGYDATTLGNHEFDYRAKGLAAMLRTAVQSGDPLPLLLTSNIDWKKTFANPEKLADAEQLQKACIAYGTKQYTAIEKGGVTVAVFGILGKEAGSFAPESGLYFKDPIETSREVVTQIKKELDPDLIVCLSHSGTSDDPEAIDGKTEDEVLAAEVPEIDLIISGHTHTELPKPITVGDTIIASCGNYTHQLGHLTLTADHTGNYNLSEYRLIPMDGSVKEDPKILTRLKHYQKQADQTYFSQYGYRVGDVLASNSKAFTPTETFGLKQGEEPLGNLIADSYLSTIEQVTGKRPDIAVVPAGVVRGTFDEGAITVADTFNVSSLGVGKDEKPGYPLVSVWLTGKELRAIAEVDATVSEMMPVARLYCSGLSYGYNPHRLFLNRAVDVMLVPQNGRPTIPEPDKHYQIVGDLYSCQMLSTVKAQSFGLLSIEPKDADGNPITDYEDHIIYDGKKELKAWYALASYIDSFEGDQIPEAYHKIQNRKVLIDSFSPVELLKQPNKIAAIAAGALLFLVLLIALISFLIRCHRRKNRRHSTR